LVALGVPSEGFVAMPTGSGTVVVVVGLDEPAAIWTKNPPSVDVDGEDVDDEVVDGDHDEVAATGVVVTVVDGGVVAALRVSPTPVWTVTRAPGVTSDGL